MSKAGGQAPGAATPVRLHWRLYRLYLIPVALAVMIAAFAFGNRPAPMSSSLAPEGFSGARAFALLHEMATLAPSRRPGSNGDRRLLGFLQRQLRAMGAPGSGGYAVRRLALDGATSFGEQRLTVLTGRRTGTTPAAPILLIAHRDAGAAAGASEAQLSGTAALLEIATVLASSETRHPLEIVFSDGGSAGGAGTAAYLKASLHGPVDAAIVLGDLAGGTLRRPLVQPFSNALGSAAEVLQNTVSSALGGALGRAAGAPSLAAQLAHLALPMSVSEQGLLNAAGVPAVAVDLAGERGAAAGEPVSRRRLEDAGRAVLSAFYALDAGGEIGTHASSDAGLMFAGRTMPGWALRLLVAALLLAPLALSIDALVRLSRRGRQAGRWISLSLSCALPFFACALAVKLLAGVGLLGAPPAPVPPEGLSFGAGDVLTLVLGVAVLALGLGAWWRFAGAPLLRRAGTLGSEGVAALCTASLLGVLVWIFNPYAALLMVPALHIWPLVVCPDRRPARRGLRVALALAPLAPLALLALYYALALGLGPSGMLLSAMLMFGGGQIGWGGALLWSLVAGLIATMLLAAAGEQRPTVAGPQRPATSSSGLVRELARAANRV